MKCFRYNTQTALFYGENCLKENADFFKSYGKRAAIITSIFHEGCENRGLADIEQILKSIDTDYIVIDSVEVDPPVSNVVELAEKARKFKPDYFIAIGGGSSIDACKAAAMILSNPEVENPYDVFYGMGSPSKSLRTESKIPVFAVPTTAGTGAEVTGFAVLTRSDTNTKLCMYPVVFCDAAFLDYRYINQSPNYLIHAGVIDALAHGVESYLHIGSNPLNRKLAEYGFELFSKFKNNMTSGNLTDEDYENMLLASYVQGMAFMQSSTTIPHGMGYPLSHLKHVCHGLANGIFLGEYLKGFKDKSYVNPIVKKCGFNNVEEFAEFCKSITVRDVNIEVSESEIQEWTDDFMKLDFRLASNPEPLGRSDIENLYRKSLNRFIK